MKLTKELVPFTQVANAVLGDATLSAKAKGIYAYLFSRPTGWQFSGLRIVADFSDGQRAIFSGLKELERAGYLARQRRPNGRMAYRLAFTELKQKESIE